MTEALQYLNSIGFPPSLTLFVLIFWRIDKRLTILEAKVS